MRYAGLIDVVDAVNDARTIGGAPPARYGAATLVVVAKTDLLDAGERRRALARVAGRARARNPRALVVEADHGRIDPLLVMDVAQEAAPPGELPLAELTRTARAEAHGGHRHAHADCLTVPAALPVSPGALADLLERPPADAYRIKGILDVAAGPPGASGGARRMVVNAVAGQVHLEAGRPVRRTEPGLVAIGAHLGDDVRAALEEALRPAREPPSAPDLARLDRIRRRSRGI